MHMMLHALSSSSSVVVSILMLMLVVLAECHVVGQASRDDEEEEVKDEGKDAKAKTAQPPNAIQVSFVLNLTFFIQSIQPCICLPSSFPTGRSEKISVCCAYRALP